MVEGTRQLQAFVISILARSDEVLLDMPYRLLCILQMLMLLPSCKVCKAQRRLLNFVPVACVRQASGAKVAAAYAAG